MRPAAVLLSFIVLSFAWSQKVDADNMHTLREKCNVFPEKEGAAMVQV
jgi:hypothetical protein